MIYNIIFIYFFEFHIPFLNKLSVKKKIGIFYVRVPVCMNFYLHILVNYQMELRNRSWIAWAAIHTYFLSPSIFEEQLYAWEEEQ